MSQGMIFNIQKFSIHDGPGIRTTIFFKGCPLRCAWCSNPESQIKDIQILYDESKCRHCLSCVQACPHQAIQVVDNQIKINQEQCQGCLTCVHRCINKALTHEGNYQSVDDIVRVCLQDIDFYNESNGGVTISGGEGMAQPEFLKDLISQLKNHSIHVAIETTGYVDKDIFQDIAKQLDLILYDVKHYDRDKHYVGTKVYNDRILENLEWLIKNQIPTLVRIPVIPEFNDSLFDAKKFSELFISKGVKRVQLLPFHQFGEKKYDLLNRDYQLKNKKALYPEDLKDYQQIFLEQGIDCFF